MHKNKIVRFALVGIINTVIDIGIFLVLRNAGLSILAANICSTSVALTVSLLLNYHYTFSGGMLTRKRIVLYIAVTLTGLWVLQPVVIKGLTELNGPLPYLTAVTTVLGHPKLFMNLVPKLGSTGVTLVWNYLWYNKVVFAKPSET